ncbi:GNAT family N-acetyltransferase [Devosia sp. FKR38]|uniref:GNAT family N-acetyltransferase n=1 Tax=Devosia sp. FKR38 TaxID=2562312 RepID=UPI0014859680|nr:GNAT family N-acetyltransferase [Devosia sp. FKR38]
MSITLRPGGPADADAVAALHNRVWQVAFAELAPPEALAKLDLNSRQAKWRRVLAEPVPDQLVLLAEDKGVLVGMAATGASDDPAFGGRAEIHSVYVDLGQQGRGIGESLLRGLARHLRSVGRDAAALDVVEGNTGAARFYQRLGAREIARTIDPGPIWKSNNVIYAWDGLDGLIG